MPGLNDPSLSNARHMSAFFRYRHTVSAAESAPTTNGIYDLNFRGAPNALDNRACVIVRRTTGADRIKLALYFQPKDGSALADVWILDRTTDWLAADTLYKFADLYAGTYRFIVAQVETSGDVFDIFLAQEGNLNGIQVE